MALVNSSSAVSLQSPFLSPFITTTTKLRTTSSSTAINAHASSSSITRHAVMNRAFYFPSLNICILIKHLGQKTSSSSSFSSPSLVVKSLENAWEQNSSVAVPSPAPCDQKFQEDDDRLITRTKSNSYHFPAAAVLPLQIHEEESSSTITVVDAPLVPLVSHDVLKRSDFPVDFKLEAGSSAQQIEGMLGRGPSTWDYAIPDGIAADSVHKYKVVYFVNSGNEANELAMLMARLYSGNLGMIALRNAYHGGSSGTIGLEGIEYLEVPNPTCLYI